MKLVPDSSVLCSDKKGLNTYGQHKCRITLCFTTVHAYIGNTEPVTNNRLRFNIHCRLLGCWRMYGQSFHLQVQIGFTIDVSVQHAQQRKLLSNTPYC